MPFGDRIKCSPVPLSPYEETTKKPLRLETVMKCRYRLKYRLFGPALIVLQIADTKATGGLVQTWRDATPEDFTSEFEL